jgi:hypothetical protein
MMILKATLSLEGHKCGIKGTCSIFLQDIKRVDQISCHVTFFCKISLIS